MPEQHMKHSTLLLLPFSFLLGTAAMAQNWIVGVPVDLPLGQLTMYGSDCAPSPDEAFNFPASTVTGVDHIAIVLDAQPPATITVVPGPEDALEAGDTIWLPVTETRQVIFSQGFGSVELDFKAVGTPTVAGQSHPCAGSDFWLSDLGLCPETLTLAIVNNCVTEATTGIAVSDMAEPWYAAPGPANGNRLELAHVALGSVQVLDLRGRSIAAPRGSAGDGGYVDMGKYPNGIYLVRAIGTDGTLRSGRFTVLN